MRVGIPNAGQVNALETLNIRGERSVTCKGKFDAHPSSGPLPKDAPAGCEEFRKQPDALERAAELDKQYGTKPDLEKLPDVLRRLRVEELVRRERHARHRRQRRELRDGCAEDGFAGRREHARQRRDQSRRRERRQGRRLGSRRRESRSRSCSQDNLAYGAWGGQPCNPYDTTRVPRGSSSGSGVAVSANFAACSICEQTGGSCKGPASRNGIVNLLTTKGILMDGGYGYQKIGDRAGIHCRTVADAVKVLDAAKGFETSDPYTALPKAMIPKEPYASFLVADERRGVEAAERHAHRRRALVHDQAHEERRGDLGPDRWRDQGRAARQARRGAGRSRRTRSIPTTRRFRI